MQYVIITNAPESIIPYLKRKGAKRDKTTGWLTMPDEAFRKAAIKLKMTVGPGWFGI